MADPLLDLIRVERLIEPLRKWEEEIVKDDTLFLAFCDAVSVYNAVLLGEGEIKEYWNEVENAVGLWPKRVMEQSNHLKVQKSRIHKIRNVEKHRSGEENIRKLKEEVDLFAEQVGILSLMFHCARFVATKADSILDLKDRGLAAAIIAQELPKEAEPENINWAGNFLLLLKHFVEGHQLRRTSLTRVPFASSDEKKGESKAGKVFTLEITVIEKAGRAVLQHPSDMLTGRRIGDEAFTRAIGDAFDLAQHAIAPSQLTSPPNTAPQLPPLVNDLSEEEKNRVRLSGVIWRVLKYQPGTMNTDAVSRVGRSAPITGPQTGALKGDSVGGAAACGISFGLLRKIPDPEVVVFAAVNLKQKSLSKVGGVKAKTKAITLAGGIDTIVVVDKENETEAIDALKELNKVNEVRVVLKAL